MPLVCQCYTERNRANLFSERNRSDVGSADVVADRIASIEKQKDGNFTTDVLSAKDVNAGDIQTYVIEYRCDTSRGTQTGALRSEKVLRQHDIQATITSWCVSLFKKVGSIQ